MRKQYQLFTNATHIYLATFCANTYHAWLHDCSHSGFVQQVQMKN